jgi:hypothetical protein
MTDTLYYRLYFRNKMRIRKAALAAYTAIAALYCISNPAAIPLTAVFLLLTIK